MEWPALENVLSHELGGYNSVEGLVDQMEKFQKFKDCNLASKGSCNFVFVGSKYDEIKV